MGSSQSTSKQSNNDLDKLNNIVKSVINDSDEFINPEYNFLKLDVCSKYQIVLESELNKFMKLELKDYGESLMLIPKESETKSLNEKNLNKKDICQRISNHYIMILYIICLIKYVYDLEHSGELSIAGIIFRNIVLTDKTIKILYCKLPQKDLENASGDEALNLDFSRLVGFKFFVDYFLSSSEKKAFINTMKSVLSRKSQQTLRKNFCSVGKIPEVDAMFQRKYNTSLKCQQGGALDVHIASNNPIFNKSWCFAQGFITIPLAEKEGKILADMFKDMQGRYRQNVAAIQNILTTDLLDSKMNLRNISKVELDQIIEKTKEKIKVFFLQSIMDYQHLLDRAKTFPGAIVE